jgi:ATP-dependent DNA helicase RecG
MIEFTAPEDRVIRSVTRKVTDTLDEKSVRILDLISEDPAYTSAAIAEKLSLSRKTVSQRLKELKEKEVAAS